MWIICLFSGIIVWKIYNGNNDNWKIWVATIGFVLILTISITLTVLYMKKKNV